MKKLFLALTGLILVLAIVVAGKTWLSPSLQGERPVAEGDLPGDEMAYAGRLADFLRLATAPFSATPSKSIDYAVMEHTTHGHIWCETASRRRA